MIIIKSLYKINQNFSKPYKSFGGNFNFKVDLICLIMQQNLDFKKATGIDTSKLEIKSNSENLKAEWIK